MPSELSKNATFFFAVFKLTVTYVFPRIRDRPDSAYSSEVPV